MTVFNTCMYTCDINISTIKVHLIIEFVRYMEKTSIHPRGASDLCLPMFLFCDSYTRNNHFRDMLTTIDTKLIY